MKDSDLLTTLEVARQMNVDITTVRRWVKRGLLPAVYLPHQGSRTEYRIQRAELEHWMSIKVKKWMRVKVD